MKLVAAMLAGVLLSSLMVTRVFAHAEPARATPGDGAVVNRPPGEIVLEMSQDMNRQAGNNDIDVFNASGTEVTTVAAVVDNSDRKRLSVALPSTLPAGKYTVKWKTVSAEDGDPAEGTLSFTVDAAAQANPGTEDLRPDLLGDPESGAGSSGTSVSIGSSDDGVTWILVVAVGIAMFVLGAGGTFLLVQKRP